jgi:hypothetical protein
MSKLYYKSINSKNYKIYYKLILTNIKKILIESKLLFKKLSKIL